jgi:hypothetical protein
MATGYRLERHKTIRNGVDLDIVQCRELFNVIVTGVVNDAADDRSASWNAETSTRRHGR